MAWHSRAMILHQPGSRDFEIVRAARSDMDATAFRGEHPRNSES